MNLWRVTQRAGTYEPGKQPATEEVRSIDTIHISQDATVLRLLDDQGNFHVWPIDTIAKVKVVTGGRL